MVYKPRAYLVIPKLIIQPTWGGTYIANFKNWNQNKSLETSKIGQSYELFSGSNLSLANSSLDPSFVGEITTILDTHKKTTPPNSISLADLIHENPAEVLGKSAGKNENTLRLLIKFTQALGNSFQLHIAEGQSDSVWKPKPESWYFFEPASITLGVKNNINWEEYEKNMTKLNDELLVLSYKVRSNEMAYTEARMYIEKFLKMYDPWQFVNALDVPKDTLIDLTACGIHHSWEENPKFPLGTIVYELQVDVSDSSSTIRNFDKGKMQEDGTVRPLHIEDYFRFANRSGEANDPNNHIKTPRQIAETDVFKKNRLMESSYYSLERVEFKKSGTFTETINSFRHIFVKNGTLKLTTGDTTIEVFRGHSAFIPSSVASYSTLAESGTILLISYV